MYTIGNTDVDRRGCEMSPGVCHKPERWHAAMIPIGRMAGIFYRRRLGVGSHETRRARGHCFERRRRVRVI